MRLSASLTRALRRTQKYGHDFAAEQRLKEAKRQGEKLRQAAKQMKQRARIEKLLPIVEGVECGGDYRTGYSGDMATKLVTSMEKGYFEPTLTLTVEQIEQLIEAARKS